MGARLACLREAARVCPGLTFDQGQFHPDFCNLEGLGTPKKAWYRLSWLSFETGLRGDGLDVE